MYPLISKWFICPGKEAQVIPALKQLALNVKHNEPGTLVYLVHTPDFTQPNLPTSAVGEVVFFEVYKDKIAFQDHLDGKDFKDFVSQYGSLFVSAHGAPYTTLEVMHHQAGFIRSAIG